MTNEEILAFLADDPCVIGSQAWIERNRNRPLVISDQWTAEQLAELRRLACKTDPPEDELSALRAENERLTAYIDKLATDNVTVGARNDAVSDENERLKAQVTQWRAIAHAAQESYAKLKAASDALLLRCEEPPIPPSGPSWLERVAAGPQRIGRPLP